MELCVPRKGQLFKGKAAAGLIMEMLKFVRAGPAVRIGKVVNMLDTIKTINAASPDMRQLGIAPTLKAIEMVARVLSAPRLAYRGAPLRGDPANQQSVHGVPDVHLSAGEHRVVKGSWNVTQQSFSEVVQCSDWIFFCFVNHHREQEFLGLLQRAGPARGMTFSRPRVVTGRHVPGSSAFVCLLMLSLVDGQGIPSQFVLWTENKRMNDQYMNNLLLKINVKLGGFNHFCQPVDAMLPGQFTMVMGADATHALGFEKPSIVAVVGSVNEVLTKYSAEVRVQRLLEVDVQGSRRAKKMDIIEELPSMAKACFNSFSHALAYIENKGRFPQQLVFFRDGVSESEYVAVMQVEVRELRVILKAACEEQVKRNGLREMIQLTYIVCGKRHNFRFEPLDKDPECVKDNCPAGTVVDDKIITPRLYDFYLQSHAAIQGTSASTHYTVLWDDHNWHPDRLHPFCNGLANNFQRATRSISMPAPVYYADIVCTRAREWFFEEDDHAATHTTPTAQERFQDLQAYQARLASMQQGLNAMAYKMWFS
ncbi:Piwi-domain-containing protein [Atractiella rhizophila]|nr:Piwi-domain-containing protein [Atractiella rhizophila]